MPGNSFDFETAEQAEAFLVSRGFRNVPVSCDWVNDAGSIAGVLLIETQHWPQHTAYRVYEIR